MVSRKLNAFALAVLFFLSPVLGLAGQPGEASPPESKGEFLRMVRDQQKRPVAMETAIVRFAPADKTRGDTVVDLVAAVHIAEKSYYQQLNREFRGYDAVLYELVAREGTRIPKGGRKGSDNPVSLLQNGLKNLLELEFQLDQIDYTRENLIHADMSPEQFARSMQDRGESIAGMFVRLIGYALSHQNEIAAGGSEADLLLALFDKHRALKLKQIMAEQFQNMDGMMAVLSGPDGSTIITERNKAALAVLKKELDAGKHKVAIFYGGGHMADMQKRLRDDFGLVPVSTRWLVAWNLKEDTRAAKVKP